MNVQFEKLLLPVVNCYAKHSFLFLRILTLNCLFREQRNSAATAIVNFQLRLIVKGSRNIVKKIRTVCKLRYKCFTNILIIHGALKESMTHWSSLTLKCFLLQVREIYFPGNTCRFVRITWIRFLIVTRGP